MSATGRVTGFTGHPVGETKTNLCVGMDKGKPLTKRALPTKQVSKKGRIQKRVKFVRDIVREVVGFAPYEKRCMELLKVGKEKRALKVRTAPPQPRLPLLHFRRPHVASQPLAPARSLRPVRRRRSWRWCRRSHRSRVAALPAAP